MSTLQSVFKLISHVITNEPVKIHFVFSMYSFFAFFFLNFACHVVMILSIGILPGGNSGI